MFAQVRPKPKVRGAILRRPPCDSSASMEAEGRTEKKRKKNYYSLLGKLMSRFLLGILLGTPPKKIWFGDSSSEER